MIKLSILDQSPVRTGGSAADALAETIELAKAADRLGYHRFWLAEHHGTDGLASSSPEILIGRIAAATENIRVGSGGVMLSHYSPLKVAENFRMLEILYPGRIDLGIGRAPGSDSATAQALAYGSQIGIDYFPNKINDLRDFLTDSIPTNHPFAQVRATPRAATVPDIWLLGSSDQSAAYAANFGLAFSFAHFISPAGGEAVMRGYRESFKPSAVLSAPAGSIGVFAIAADTEEKAHHIAMSRNLWRLKMEKGEPGAIPSIEEALAYPYSDTDRARIAQISHTHHNIGAPEQIRDKLMATAKAFGVDEIVILSICFDFEDRLRSHELIAKAFELEPRMAGGAGAPQSAAN